MAEELMNPRGITHYEKTPIAPRDGVLKNKVLGIVDNSKPNADLFLNRVAEALKKNHALAEILRIRKTSGAVPAPLTPEFFHRCDLVINGVGD
jgi:hypothetical protein